jgi:xylulokinase
MVTINATEGSAYGAALLAVTGTGGFASVEEACRSCIRVTDRCEPDAGRARMYQEYYAIYRDLYPCLRESFRAVAAVR